MISDIVYVESLGITPRGGDKEEMMNFLKWLESLGEGISIFLSSGATREGEEPKPIEVIFEEGYWQREITPEYRKTALGFDSWIVFDILPQWLTLPESYINVQFQNWNDKQFVVRYLMSTLLTFSSRKKAAELGNNAPDLLRIAKATHLRYKPLLTVIGRGERITVPYNMDKPRLWADWVTIIGAEFLRKRKITLPKAPDTLTVEDLDGDTMISSKLSYPDFVKQGFSEEEKSFWKSIGATVMYNPKRKEPKDDSETYIVKDSPEGLYLEPLDKEKFFGEKRD